MKVLSGGGGDSDLCRISKYGTFGPRDFFRISCANCYKLLDYVMDKMQTQLETTLAYNITPNGYLVQGALGNQTFIDPTVPSDLSRVRGTMNEMLFDKWRECCQQAELCCTNVMIKDRFASNFI